MKRLRSKIRQYISGHRTRKYVRNTMMVFACIITFITTYTLILPALTLEKGALICGKEVHEHTDRCYEEVLICTRQESAGHTHGEECYYYEPVLICGEPEHTHTEECFDEEGNLICDWEEHEHGENCYDKTATQTCTLEESEGHIHDASCYEKQLVCGMEQHVHSQSCYENVEEPAAKDQENENVEESVSDNQEEEIPAEDPSNESGEEAVTDEPKEESGEINETNEEDTSSIDTLIDDETNTSEENEEEEESSTEEIPEEEAYEENIVEESLAEESSVGEFTEESTEETGLSVIDFASTLTNTSGLWLLNAENVWEKVDENTQITLGDNLMVRLSYHIPAGSLDAGNAMISYTLPKSILMDQERADYINNEQNYLNQIISGTRLPEETVEQYSGAEYLAGTYVVGLPSALDETLRAGISGLYATTETSAEEGWNLVCTFNEYSVYENATADLEGWLMFYLTGAELATDENGWGSIIFSENNYYGEKLETVYRVGGTDETESSEENFEEISAEETSEEASGEETRVEEGSEEAIGEETSVEETSAEEISEKETSEEETTGEETSEEAEETSEMSEEEKAGLAIEFPAQTFEQSTGNVTVTVYAGTGAFPAGTTMFVEDIDDEDTVAAVVDAVNENADTQKATEHVLAADITFYDKDGQKIEPLIPIHVVMTPVSVPENISQDAVPVIVHVDDAGNTEVMEQRDVSEVVDEIREEESSRAESSEAASDEAATNEAATNDVASDEVVSNDENVAGDNDNSSNESDNNGDQQNIDEQSGEGTYYEEMAEETVTEASVEDILPLPNDAIVFDADSFSIYAMVYTVDFHWEVNGQAFEFSIPGGGFVSFYYLLEVLNIEADDPNTEIDEIQKLVNGVENIEFSNPELVSVSKVEEDTTVGAIKERLSLECEYSAELTEEKIDEINAQEANAGDWALIALKPFTSEEILTITMENGDLWTVKVTDALVGSTGDIDGSKTYVIYTEINSTYYVLKTDGTTYQVTNREDLDALTNEYKWQFTYVYTDRYNVPFYNIHPANNQYQTLTLNWFLQPLVQTGNNNVTISPYGGSNGGYVFGGYNGVVLHNDLTGDFNGVVETFFTPPSRIMIYEQEQLNRYKFTVSSDDYSMGYVSGKNVEGTSVDNQAEFDSRTNAQKANDGKITATPQSDKYLFDYWDLNGTKLSYSNTISNDSLTIPYQGSKLTAHFKRNPNWQATDDEKEGRVIDKESLQEWMDELKGRQSPLNNTGCNKTSELYDYENRIYRVDLTAQSDLTMFNGSIDMGFIMDVSGSMQFPSKLTEATGTSGQNLSDINISQINQWDVSRSQYYWQTWGLDTNKYYYVIAEKTTNATVFRVNYHTDDNKWHRVDGSFYPGDGVYNAQRDAEITTSQTFYTDPAGTHYQLYVDGDAPKRRLHYLQSSMDGTIDEMQEILNLFAIANNPTENQGVSVAWNTFCATVTNTQHSFLPVLTSPPTFVWDTAGGTRTDKALKDALDFNWGNSNTKYAVLITDGAPQKGSNDSEPQTHILNNVRSYAQQLRNRGITLITVGLSMKDVKVGSVLLYDIASTDNHGDPYFYSAQSGDELQYILYEILQKAMDEAIVEGNVTDTINEAFYPVDKTSGKPLENGDKIDLAGNLIIGAPTGAYGEIKEASGIYTVEWKNQEFTWGGWHGTFYQKAKEDFLGGNAVRTNDGNAIIEATGYKMKPGDNAIEFNDETKRKGYKELETPRVNVNELNLLENNTEWTVYLGTEVNPREQLEELYNSILVEEVVDSAIDTNNDGFKDKVQYETDNNHYRFSIEESSSDQRTPARARVTFPLKDIIPLSSDQWDSVIEQSENDGDDNEGLSFTYEKYGQDCPGTITIKLVKNHDPDKHKTVSTGTPVETYILTVMFEPDYVHIPIGQGGDPEQAKEYHTGTFGLGYQGHAAGTDTSTNEHRINVFAKKMEILKADQEGKMITNDPATFVLYRKATTDEIADATVTKTDLTGLTGKYIAVQTLVTSGGSVTTDALPVLADNESYYLVEIKPPAGYIMLAEPLKVTIDMTGHNTWTKTDDNSTSQEKPNPYVLSNWLQEATIKLWNLDGTAYDASYTSTYDHTNDTTDASVTYKILNNAGYELPSTGGIGTTLIYLYGIMLTGLGGVGLVMKRRKNAE